MFCLPLEYINKLKEALKSGKINPEKLSDMTSSERRTFLETIVGKENAQEVNLLFEKKLLLKNQEQAMYNWASEITGLSKEAKEATLAKIKETYAEKKRRVYDPKETEAFLNEITSDVYSRKYKTEVSLEEAQTITELAQDAKQAEGTANYGAAKVALDNYVGKLKTEAAKITFGERIGAFKEKGVIAKAEAVGNLGKFSLNFIAENSRALKASFDNSFWGRQGIKVALNPKYSGIWAKNFAKSFTDFYETLKGGNKAGDAIIDAVKADIYNRENFSNGNYERGRKLDVGIREEEFPTSLPSQIPALGRVFKASEVAYEAGAMRLRADLADKFYAMAEKQGIDLTNKVETSSINQLVNSMTGRGGFGGRGEGAQALLNKAFFSVKFFKSNLDFLTAHAGSNFSPFARKQAAQNLLTVVSSIGTILTIANALDPDSVTFDPRSSDFGKIKWGNTRFDITGGAGSLVILTARILAQSTKSSVTGKVTKLGEGYGAPTGMDIFWQFTENKFSPMFSVIKELIDQETFEGDRPTLINEMKNLTIPILIEQGFEAKDEKTANLLLMLIADGLGISANTYALQTNWAKSATKELTDFKAKVGDKKFQEANDKFNKLINAWFVDFKNTAKYKNASDDDKQKFITAKRKELKTKVFSQYGFRPR